MKLCSDCGQPIEGSEKTARCERCRSQARTASRVRYELKMELGLAPPEDLVAEATAIRLLNRAIREL